MEQASSGDLWEKSARLLMLNPANKLEEFIRVIHKVCKNISDNPQEAKFKSLKVTNSTIQNKIVAISGGVEVLAAVGFRPSLDDEGVKVLRIPPDLDNEQLSSSLLESLEWIDRTVATCIECVKDGDGGNDIPCAECVINLKLPTGASVFGGFWREDKIQDIVSYASTYFVKERATAVSLMLPDIHLVLDESHMQQTLSELDLCPRAVVVASILTPEEREERLTRQHNDGQFVQAKASQVNRVKQEKT